MYGIIDIGSASIRMYSGGKKVTVMTKLAENLDKTGKLSQEAMLRTAAGIKKFADILRAENKNVLAFATEAVRAASNGMEFVSLVKDMAGTDIEIIQPEDEALLAYLGACNGGSGTVLDIGGASVEIISGAGGKILYAKSLPLGAVRLTEYACGDIKRLEEHLAAEISKYGDTRCRETLYGVGGTLTSLAAMDMQLKEYDTAKVDGYILTSEKINKIKEELCGSSTNDIVRKYPFMPPMRAEIITAGCVLAGMLLDYLGVDCITVTESDNLIGYMRYKHLS